MIQKVLAFIRKRKGEALSAHAGEYKDGYITAMEDVEEYVEELEWEAGIDDDY